MLRHEGIMACLLLIKKGMKNHVRISRETTFAHFVGFDMNVKTICTEYCYTHAGDYGSTFFPDEKGDFFL
jgi:hypothetical protein